MKKSILSFVSSFKINLVILSTFEDFYVITEWEIDADTIHDAMWNKLYLFNKAYYNYKLGGKKTYDLIRLLTGCEFYGGGAPPTYLPMLEETFL